MSLPKVSVVQYLNTAPLVWGMLHGEQRGRYEMSFTTPALCADALRRREVDVGIIPSIEYQRLEKAQIIAGVSIAAKNAVKSVLLLSKVPVAKIQTVALDYSSRTSAALLGVMMSKFYLRRIATAPAAPMLEDMLKSADAALLIGDPALTYQSRVPEAYDLAAEWRKFTGLPFVFAIWVGYEDARLGKFGKDFLDSRDFGLAHVDDIAAEHAPLLKMEPEAVKVYLTRNIDYSLDDENCRGLRLFYKLAAEEGIIPGVKELSFA